jgi:hypothetical protein
LTIAQPFKAGIRRPETSQVPSGTKGACARPAFADGHHVFCRPSRDS